MKPKLVKNSNPPEKHFGKYRNRTTRVCGYVISIGGTDNNNAWLRLLVGKRTKRILLSTLAKWDFIEEPT